MKEDRKMNSGFALARPLAMVLATASLPAISVPATAQRGSGPGGGGTAPGGAALPQPSGTVERMQDRDRIQDPDIDRDKDQDRLRDRDKLQSPDQLRDRDRDRLQIDRNVEGQIASWQLLSDQERQQFHNRIMQATTAEERNRIRSEYQNMIQQRASDLGVAAPFGPMRAGSGTRDGYFLAQTLTQQERLQFHQRMRQAATNEERNQIRTEMQTTARERAQEMGIEVPAWFGNGPGNN
jgi:Skp family chaperone for outer membrane proteins